MTKLLTGLFAAAFAFGLNAAVAQNVTSDQDKAQGQEQKMQEKEQRTNSVGGQSGERERAKTEDSRNAPSAGGPTSPDKAESAMNCQGKTGHDKEECLEHANGKPADEDDAGAAGKR